ncbi:Acyl-CoA carboxylase epsilon subunit [Propionibacterium cyclohexanicum]|uniref:Acyl-CoA carboxylase epsilon subunit n=1 Tax=Propionibacterium cyclohexanicum TaxID=64702 RepID=A0A1H9QF62_9ACTN|nr:acyl-CoA carboxylase subunit epsilon [Propionibacterium cyclohexanicum]SER59114.1 Acyl-CoA carboxylase epsilon subunit [Propionibacterium cyclohexanicum]
MSARSEGQSPVFPLQVTKGEPTDEELGALSVVLSAMLAPAPARENVDRTQLSGWKSYWRTIRQPLMHGREAWGSSLR